MPIKKTLPDKYLSAEVRRERVLWLMPSKGFDNLQQLADDMGVHRGFLVNALKSEGITATTICRVANSLGCSSLFLMED